MKVLAIRQTIAEALEFANALEHVTEQDLAAFVAGSQPLTIEQIRLDSLARMELLIALETEHGVAVTPAAFERFESLAALADAPITINDPDCVSKTFPDYFEKLSAITRS